jgi:hypothetical protein
MNKLEEIMKVYSCFLFLFFGYDDLLLPTLSEPVYELFSLRSPEHHPSAFFFT